MNPGNWIDPKMASMLQTAAKESGTDVKKLIELIEAYFKYVRICMASALFPEIQIINFGKFRPYFYKLVNRKNDIEKRLINDEIVEDREKEDLQGIIQAVNRLEREKTKRKQTKLKPLKK